MSLSEFFNMGGYAIYVWPSYVLAAIVLWLNWYLPRRAHRQLLGQLKQRNQGRSESHDTGT